MFDYECTKCKAISSFIRAPKAKNEKENPFETTTCTECGKKAVRIYNDASGNFNIPPGQCGNYKNGYNSPQNIKRGSRVKS